MKTLKNYTLYYDESCPVCIAYTSAFVKTGMLDENGRTQFSKADFSKVDEDRARNEIALLNKETGEVIYGLESILKVLAFNSPVISFLGKTKIINSILNALYKFISFNRKVIVPTDHYLQDKCVPDFKISYRLAYLIFAAIISSVILYNYSSLLGDILPASNLLREAGMCFGQIFFQSFMLTFTSVSKKTIFDYLGNMMSVSLIGSLLLLPALMTGSFFTAPAFFLAYFFLVVLYMLYMHVRRVKWIGAPAWLSLSWVLYRLIVLAFILY